MQSKLLTSNQSVIMTSYHVELILSHGQDMSVTYFNCIGVQSVPSTHDLVTPLLYTMLYLSVRPHTTPAWQMICFKVKEQGIFVPLKHGRSLDNPFCSIISPFSLIYLKHHVEHLSDKKFKCMHQFTDLQ